MVSSQRCTMATPTWGLSLTQHGFPLACITARASTQVANPSAIPERAKRLVLEDDLLSKTNSGFLE